MNWQQRYQRMIARRLSPWQLQATHQEELRMDVLASLTGPPEQRGAAAFLGYYSPEGLEYALKAYGVFDLLRLKGFKQVLLQTDTSDPYLHRLSLYDTQVADSHLLHEVVLRHQCLTFSAELDPALAGQAFQTLSLEWICIQDPRKQFSEIQEGFPGQDHPGLGLSSFVLSILQLTAERLGLDGVVTIPGYLHNAVMYGRYFRYLDPRDEGRLRALERDLLHHQPLKPLAWAAENGHLLENGSPFHWFHSQQLMAISRPLQAYLAGPWYQQQMAHTRLHTHFTWQPNSE